MKLLLRDLAVRQEGFQLDLGQGELTFAEGTVTLLLGTVGSGKTTLLLAASGFLPVERGVVEYGGIPLWSEDGKRWNTQQTARIGLVPDEPDQQFFASTVREELLYSLHGGGRKQADAADLMAEALAAVGLAPSEEALALSPFALSGGQKRRLALAAVLLRKPVWLLLDEPSIGLDAEGLGHLVHILREQKERAEGGILIATHDAASFWELADRILIIEQGRIKYDGTPGELAQAPEILQQAGLGIPPALALAHLLGVDGVPALARGHMLSPAEMADLLVTRLGKQPAEEDHPTSRAAIVQQAPVERAQPKGTPAVVKQRTSPLMRMDPRAVWLFLLLATLGVWQQTKPLGLVVGTVLTLAIVLYSRVPFAALLRLCRIYAFILLFTVALAGLDWADSGPLLLRFRFDLEQAAGSFVRLYRLYLALWLGLLLPLTQSQLRLKRVLTQSLAPLGRVGFPAEAMALATSLLFRFIPLIRGEWQRFFLLARIRRRAFGRGGRLSLSDMRPLLVPFLLSLLRLADQVAYALEARGYARAGTKRTMAETFRFTRKDYGLMLAGVLLAVSLYLVGR